MRCCNLYSMSLVRLTAHGLHQLMDFINEHKHMLTPQQQQQQQQQQKKQKHSNGSHSAVNDIMTHIEMTSRSFISIIVDMMYYVYVCKYN